MSEIVWIIVKNDRLASEKSWHPQMREKGTVTRETVTAGRTMYCFQHDCEEPYTVLDWCPLALSTVLYVMYPPPRFRSNARPSSA
jgi:hypothetical protein